MCTSFLRRTSGSDLYPAFQLLQACISLPLACWRGLSHLTTTPDSCQSQPLIPPLPTSA